VNAWHRVGEAARALRAAGRTVGADARGGLDALERLRRAGVSVAALRRGAALTVRCADCGGRVVLTVTYLDGRPLLWTAGRGGRGAGLAQWADRWQGLERAYCGRRQWTVNRDTLAAAPAPGMPPRTVAVSHIDAAGMPY
jgi:hypothetical protein